MPNLDIHNIRLITLRYKGSDDREEGSDGPLSFCTCVSHVSVLSFGYSVIVFAVWINSGAIVTDHIDLCTVVLHR